MNYDLFTTTNRTLEQFLYAHRIDFIRSFRTEDGCSAWQYARTERFERILAEFKEVYPEGSRPRKESRYGYRPS